MSTSTLSQKTYELIQGMILSGELSTGSVVSELSLAKRIGVSRTPVREAIRQLTVEGLVEQVPRFGTIVRAPDRKELNELYEVREALEGYAVAAAARRITPSDLELAASVFQEMLSVRNECRQRDIKLLEGTMLRRFLAADMGFHMILIRAGGNRKIMKIVADTRTFTRIFGTRRQAHDLPMVTTACRFHREILQAVQRRDSAAARLWMARHIRVSRKQMLESFSHHEAHVGEPIPLGIPDHLIEEFNRFNLGLHESPPEEPS
jgi:DNA-binding GntR family transcriptional regulator